MKSIGDLYFFKYIVNVGFNRMWANAKLIRDHTIRGTLSNHGKDFYLSMGEVFAIALIRWERLSVIVQDTLRHNFSG